MTEFKWFRLEALLILHEEGLSEHGGLPGIRDRGLLESALEAPKNKAFYEDDADVFTVAATYAHAIAKKPSILQRQQARSLSRSSNISPHQRTSSDSK